MDEEEKVDALPVTSNDTMEKKVCIIRASIVMHL